jgi:tRNA modification GTPase
MVHHAKNREETQMNDTIAAIATPPGRGGVGVIRISGPNSSAICKTIIGVVPKPRVAHYAPFLDSNGSKIDEGLALFFNNPNSFTGEDVLELQGHGGPVVLDMLLRRIVSLGARLARAGEFSERAFLNNKMDLVQAEAVAQLISASTEQAATAAMRSLQGEFSKTINTLVEELIRLRLYVEAAIDFPEEEINFLADAHVMDSVTAIVTRINQVYERAKHGVVMEEGVNVVIAGAPNAGKSTLLNKLSGIDAAIVTPIAGTTRDIVKAQVNLDGVVLNVLDTAGLRSTDDVLEQAGIARTRQAIELADLVLLVVDITAANATDINELTTGLKSHAKVIVVHNKIDCVAQPAALQHHDTYTTVQISANTGAGLDLLRAAIKAAIGITDGAQDAGMFLARRRHLDALQRAAHSVSKGQQQLQDNMAGELLAEELKHAQLALSEITGQFTSDDLLGRIFSEFCIGK